MNGTSRRQEKTPPSWGYKDSKKSGGSGEFASLRIHIKSNLWGDKKRDFDVWVNLHRSQGRGGELKGGGSLRGSSTIAQTKVFAAGGSRKKRGGGKTKGPSKRGRPKLTRTKRKKKKKKQKKKTTRKEDGISLMRKKKKTLCPFMVEGEWSQSWGYRFYCRGCSKGG